MLTIVFHTQIEIGQKRKTTDKETNARRKSSKRLSATVEPAVSPPYQVGQFVAMCCQKYNDYKPQIAKLKKINGSAGTVNIEWFDGSYETVWKAWKVGGRIIKDTVPMRAILMEVKFSKEMQISKKLKSELDKKYASVEFV